jgi:hypothetical protein
MTESSMWSGHLPFAWALLEMARPDVLVELGTYKGDSYCGFCQGVAELKLATKCFAIDTWKGDSQTGIYSQRVFEQLWAYHEPRYGRFAELMQATFDEAAPRFEAGSIDLLHIDGLHTYEAVRRDYETWRPKLSARGVILFHDIAVRQEGWGVWKLWEELREQHLHFEFENDSGLGVLGVGDALPVALREFLQLEGSERKLARRYFEVLAGRLRFGRLLLFNRSAADRAAQATAHWRAQTARPPHPPVAPDDYISLMARLVRDTTELVQENLSLRGHAAPRPQGSP